ncbi:MAG: glucokinase [Desulfobulbus sp.]|nr:glucokinase [Desulfobulbus sp.]
MAVSRADVLLAGDIGATKTTLALFAPSAGAPGSPLRQQTCRNAGISDFTALLEKFLGNDAPQPVSACFGVAGPVIGNTVRMTNLNWVIDGQDLQTRFGWQRVVLINDLVATAMGISQLTPADVEVINRGERRDGSAVAVLAPGSGLGEAFLVFPGGRTFVCASEGGHASFAPRNEEQIELLNFLLQRHPHVSVERVCSGMAVPGLFAFLAGRMEVPSWLEKELAEADDKTPVIVQAALAAHRGEAACDVAVQTLRLLIDILADEAANLALKTLALGGVYIGGGFAARILPFVEQERFMRIFCRGRYAGILSRIPVSLMTNPQTALFGAAAHGVQDMTHESSCPGHRS